MMIIVKPEQLNRVCKSLKPDRCALLADIMNRKIAEYGIKTWDEFHEFIGQVVHESGEFVAKTENMNYSAQRLAEVWPGTFSTTKKPPYSPNALALKFSRKPVELANYKYGSKYGNRPGTNDGWTFRGGGFIGITFRSLWKLYANYKDLEIEQCAEWVRTTDEGAMDSAFWFFYVYKKLWKLAIDDNDIGLSLAINGGKIGLQNRIYYSNMARKFLY